MAFLIGRTENPRWTWLVCLILALLTMGALWPLTNHDFVNYDDPDYVTENPHVLGGLTLQNVAWAFTTGRTGNWIPLTWLSHMLDVQCFGINPKGHHAISLSLHALNTVLLFLLLRRLTGATWPSAMVAALFAIHPVHVESVAWVAERKDVLSTWFGLLSLYGYARYAQKASRPLLWYLLALSCFALSLMSKPMLVTLPFLMLLLDYWPLKRFDPREAVPAHKLGRLVIEKAPFLVLTVVFCIVAIGVQAGAKAIELSPDRPFETRLANALVSYLRYLGKAIWPSHLAVFYPPHAWALMAVFSALAVLALITVVVVRFSRRFPYLIVGWFWFVGTLVPVIGLIQVGAQALADRYTYVPFIGLFIALAWGGADLAAHWAYRPAWLSLCVAILAALVAGSRAQSACWANSRALFEHALSVTSGNMIAHNNLGILALRDGHWAEAERHFAEAGHTRPSLPEARLNYALALAHRGKTDEALAQAGKLLNSTPDARTQLVLGHILLQAGRLEEAVAHYLEALKSEPDSYEIESCLGSTLAQLQKIPEAITHFEAAARLMPNNPDAHFNLGNILAGTERIDEAAKAFEAAIRLNPQDTAARERLGMLLLREGKGVEAGTQFGEVVRVKPAAEPFYYLGLALQLQRKPEAAAEQYRRALELKPSWPEPMNDLAWILATNPKAEVRNGREAVRLAEKACELNGRKEARFLGTLDAAYAEAGRFSDAISTAERARELALGAGQTEVRDAAEQRLALYRQGKPFHESELVAQ